MEESSINEDETEITFMELKPILNVEQQYLNMVEKISKEGKLRLTRNASTYFI